jgi:hypothetical protein
MSLLIGCQVFAMLKTKCTAEQNNSVKIFVTCQFLYENANFCHDLLGLNQITISPNCLKFKLIIKEVGDWFDFCILSFQNAYILKKIIYLI